MKRNEQIPFKSKQGRSKGPRANLERSLFAPEKGKKSQWSRIKEYFEPKSVSRQENN